MKKDTGQGTELKVRDKPTQLWLIFNKGVNTIQWEKKSLQTGLGQLAIHSELIFFTLSCQTLCNSSVSRQRIPGRRYYALLQGDLPQPRD